MSGLLLPFARHIPTGKTVAPEEVERGNACDCECLFCGAPVQARHCNTKANHFAHQPKVIDDDNPCPACFERCIFWMTKRILEEGTEIAVPEYKLALVDYIYEVRREYRVTEAQVLPYQLVEFPDISTSSRDHIAIALSINGYPLRLIMSYEQQLRESRDSSVHISLDFLKRMYKDQKQGFLLAMRLLILESLEAKTWLFHSEERNGKCKKHFDGLVKEAKAKRDAKQQAIQRENKCLRERRRLRSSESAPSGRTAAVAKRLQELVSIAYQATQSGSHYGWQCTSCFVVSDAEQERCIHCGSSSFSVFALAGENMTTLYNRFYCGNYAGRSLGVTPRLAL